MPESVKNAEMKSGPTTVLAITSFEKGQDFLRECKTIGARVILLTVESLKDAAWPRDILDDVFLMPDLYNRVNVLNAVSYLARSEHLSRIVPLDEFDVEMAATIREHLRIPGMNESTARFFRDKLAMRIKAHEAGMLVPPFTRLFPYDAIRDFFALNAPPWVLKPRMEASAVGIKKLTEEEQVWRALDGLHDLQSHHLLEQFIPGNVYHVDSIVVDGKLVLAECHGYFKPPFEVYHGGGLFRTNTLARGSDDERELRRLTQQLATSLGMDRGILHTEFIRAASDGRFYFLETAARVGGAYIAEMVQASTGVNLWREWARLEVATARGEEYRVQPARQEYGAVILTLARQEWPDTSSYPDAEIVYRIHKEHHAGFVMRSADHERITSLLNDYGKRFMHDFAASMPAKETLR
jgi:biotin carboxylase